MLYSIGLEIFQQCENRITTDETWYTEVKILNFGLFELLFLSLQVCHQLSLQQAYFIPGDY